MSKLGCGRWEVYLQTRGGGSVLGQFPFTNLDIRKQLDDAGAASLTVPLVGPTRSACCELLNLAEPWIHELIFYRDGDDPFVGPLTAVEVSPDGATLQSPDLFFWTERRFIEEDLFLSADASAVFEAIFDKAMEADNSPGIEVVAHDSGVDVVREIAGQDFQRAADLLRELSRTAVDFTTIGRQILVGGQDIFTVGVGPGTPLIIHDDGVTAVTVSKDGLQFASDVAVFAESTGAGGDRITGRATRSQLLYGLVQSSFAEPLIRDTPSADSNALARLREMQPTPKRLNVTFSQEAAFTYAELIPGRRADMRISANAGCAQVFAMMRMTGVDVSVSEGGDKEVISADIVPLGAADA